MISRRIRLVEELLVGGVVKSRRWIPRPEEQVRPIHLQRLRDQPFDVVGGGELERRPAPRRRRWRELTPEDLEDLRAAAADPQPQDLEGLAWACAALLEERDRLGVQELLERGPPC